MAIRAIYRQAVDREILPESPVGKIRAPKSRPKAQKFLTWTFLEKSHFGKYDNQIKFLPLHGLRWGEAVALQETDIYDGQVHISRSVNGPTKTPSGVRVVPYFGFFAQFPRSRRAIAQELSEHGVTIHSLRKTYAYFLKMNNVHVTTAAKFMGHSDPGITLKIYTLVRDEEVVEVGNKIREIYFQSKV